MKESRVLENKNYVIRKHNDLITADYRLPELEQKVIVYLLALIKPEDNALQRYLLDVPTFSKLMPDYYGDLYTDLMRIINNFKKQGLYIKNKYHKWFAKIEHKRMSGHAFFHFNPSLKPYLINVKKDYTEYNSKSVLSLSDGPTIRLFELLRSQSFVKGEAELLIPLADLKKHLGFMGKYSLYRDFREQFLSVTMLELAAKSEIRFTYSAIQTGKVVTSVNFKIFENSGFIQDDEDIVQKSPKILKRSKVSPVKRKPVIVPASGIIVPVKRRIKNGI